MSQSEQYWAFLNTEWDAGRLTRPGGALQSLRSNPESFLKKYPLTCTFDPPTTRVMQAYIFNGAAGQRPGTILKTRNMHETESFIIQGAPGQLREGHPFWVHGLHTAQGGAGPVVWYRLDAGGPDIMLTAKLTGCTFVARSAGPGAVEVAHLQPNANINGVALNTLLNQPGQRAYGRLNYDIEVRSINVLGVRVNGNWQIYAQKLEKNHAAIRSVTKIYPV